MEYLILAFGYALGVVTGAACLRVFQLRQPQSKLPHWVQATAKTASSLDLDRSALSKRLKTACQLLVTSEHYGRHQ